MLETVLFGNKGQRKEHDRSRTRDVSTKEAKGLHCQKRYNEGLDASL